MNKAISIYTLTSPLHDEEAVATATKEFLSTLDFEYDMNGNDWSDYGSYALNLIFVRTGGTEGVFKPLLPQLQTQSSQPFYLLTSGKSNSLAASMEILSYLRQRGIQGEIIHGSSEYVNERIHLLTAVEKARLQLRGCRLGVIGKPSDWLISSSADKITVKKRLGIELIDIDMDEMKQLWDEALECGDAQLEALAQSKAVKDAVPGAIRIYNAISEAVRRHSLDGFTIRCFDLLTAVGNTGCVALAKLNSKGKIAGCEGDVPAMLSMMLGRAVTGVSGFQANPARINPQTGELLFAHCTIPFDMVERYELDTHFESGKGIGIRGYMKEGPVTIFKVSGDLSRSFIAEGTLVRNQGENDLCRTQQVIRLDDKHQAGYFLNNPIGNHHIILPGHCKATLEALLA